MFENCLPKENSLKRPASCYTTHMKFEVWSIFTAVMFNGRAEVHKQICVHINNMLLQPVPIITQSITHIAPQRLIQNIFSDFGVSKYHLKWWSMSLIQCKFDSNDNQNHLQGSLQQLMYHKTSPVNDLFIVLIGSDFLHHLLRWICQTSVWHPCSNTSL